MTDSRVLEELSEGSRQKVMATGCPVHSLSEDSGTCAHSQSSRHGRQEEMRVLEQENRENEI